MNDRVLHAFHLTRRGRSPRALTSGPAFLAACGVRPDELVRSTSAAGSERLSVYFRDASEVSRLARAFVRMRPAGWAWRRVRMGPADWLTKWQRTYRIGPMGRTFAIVPLWRREEFRGRRTPIFIDPQGSFGSGTHETTRLVVELMEGLKGRFSSFLDVGTGTGVLLVVADRLAARRALGVDIDPQAVRTAKGNLKHNRVGPGVSARIGDIRRPFRPGYDLVAANLLSRTLVESASALAASVKPGGRLIVSGIERSNWRWFVARFRPSGCARVKTRLGRRWCAALYRRKK